MPDLKLNFDPAFDDCTWTDAWVRTPIIQVVPGDYGSFSIKSWQMTEADVCGRQLQLSPPLEVRGLHTPDGTLWMSDVPQERLMMFNNARASLGRILVGGLGLGLYPQYVLPRAEELTIIERHARLAEVVMSVVRIAGRQHDVPLSVRVEDIETVLKAAPDNTFDTIFLDTWDTLDAANLPSVNRLRNLALRYLTPSGRVLLWGYAWMVRLFLTACKNLLRVEPGMRSRWLTQASSERPAARALLAPVMERFAGQHINDLDAALAWCRDYVVNVTD